MRACGPGEFRASLEAQLVMVARRLSHRVVAIGFLPPSSESWRPTHSTHKFTRAPRRDLLSVRSRECLWLEGSSVDITRVVDKRSMSRVLVPDGGAKEPPTSAA